jgi:tripeptidyl-peptidase-1
MGNNYVFVANNSFHSLSGSNAATPVVAGMISLVNSEREAAGNPSLGFLNPFLYSKASSFVWDITSGNNLCTASASHCCQQGFYSASGW